MYDEGNDGRFPDESPVEVRYPRSKQEEQGDRERWPWLPASIVDSAARTNGTCVSRSASWPCCAMACARRGTASRNLCYPCCFRDSSEIRPRPASCGPASALRRGASR